MLIFLPHREASELSLKKEVILCYNFASSHIFCGCRQTQIHWCPQTEWYRKIISWLFPTTWFMSQDVESTLYLLLHFCTVTLHQIQSCLMNSILARSLLIHKFPIKVREVGGHPLTGVFFLLTSPELQDCIPSTGQQREDKVFKAVLNYIAWGKPKLQETFTLHKNNQQHLRKKAMLLLMTEKQQRTEINSK